MKLIFTIVLFAAGVVFSQERESAVSLSFELDREVINPDANNLIFLRAIIEGKQLDVSSERKPLNICLVIDRSGSMAGERIEYTRKAVSEVFSKLSPDDTFSLVSYGSDVKLVVEASKVSEIKSLSTLVQEIEAEGGSSTYDALNQAAAQLRRLKNVEGINRVILLSDGLATKGPREFEDFTSLAEIFSLEGISLSTIGLGDEFDEDLLSELADIAHGNFHYLQAPEDLAASFVSEIELMKQLLARDVVVEVDFTRFFYPQNFLGRDGTLKGRTVTLEFGDLYEGQVLEAVIVILSQGVQSSGGKAKFASFQLSYDQNITGDEFRIVEEHNMQISTTQSSAISNRSLNLSVIHSALRYQISEEMEKALKNVDKGKLGYAIRDLKRNAQELRRLNFEYEDEEIERMHLQLTAFTERLEAHGLNRIDRKLMRLKIYQTESQSFTEDDEEE